MLTSLSKNIFEIQFQFEGIFQKSSIQILFSKINNLKNILKYFRFDKSVSSVLNGRNAAMYVGKPI